MEVMKAVCRGVLQVVLWPFIITGICAGVVFYAVAAGFYGGLTEICPKVFEGD